MSNINKILNLSKKGYKKNSPHVDRPFNVIPSNEITMKEDDGTPLKKGPILGIGIGNGKVIESKKMIPGKNYKFSDNVTHVIEEPLQLGGQYTPKERMGVRQNTDGSVSSHLMMSEVLPNGNWVSFPSLFQNEDGSWVDMSEKTSWYPIYLEALKRGEVYNFGKNKEAALEFGRGSWKKEYRTGGSIPKFQTGDEKPVVKSWDKNNNGIPDRVENEKRREVRVREPWEYELQKIMDEPIPRTKQPYNPNQFYDNPIDNPANWATGMAMGYGTKEDLIGLGAGIVAGGALNRFLAPAISKIPGSSQLLSKTAQVSNKLSSGLSKGLSTPAVVGGKSLPWLTAGNLLDAYSLAMVPKIAGKTYDAFSEGDYYGGATGILETGFYGLGAMNPLLRTQLADDLSSLYSGSKQALKKRTIPTSPFSTRAQNDVLLNQARKSGEAPLPSYMEPYISRRYTPASKEQDIFESFLSPKKQAELRQSRTQTFTPEGVNTPKQQGGTIPKFQTGDEKKPVPNLFNFDPTPEYVGYQGNVPVSESTRVVNTYRPTQQEIKATKEYAQKVGATAQAIRNKTGVSQKEAMQQAEQVLGANSRVQSEAKAYANTKQAQERDAYVFDEGMNARDYFRYPLQFLSGNVPTQEERIQDRIRITDPRTSNLDKFMGTVGEAVNLAPEALLNTGIGLAFAPANLSKLGMVADAVSPIGNPLHPDFIKGINKAGDYLTTQTPLRNAYRLNPKALKENPEMFLYRAEPTDFDTRNTIKILQEKLANNEGNAIQQARWKNYINEYNQGNPKLVAQNDFHGQWLEKNPARLDWYLHSGDKVDVETPMSIFRTKIPTSQAAQYNVGNIKKANLISASPETEFVMPRNIIEQGEKFPESSWQQLIQEDKAFNTPHWLRGYGSNTPTSPFKGVRAQNDILLEQARRSGVGRGNINVPKNLEDLKAAQSFAEKYDYDLPKNIERISQSNVLTDRTIRGLMNRHNTFVRGVSTNWEELSKINPKILKHLEDKGFNLSTPEGTKAAAEYMATHVPINTGYGRHSLDGESLAGYFDGLYTSNSIPTAEGYTYGQGYVTKVRRPTDFSSTNRVDWINQNNPLYYENRLPGDNSITVGGKEASLSEINPFRTSGELSIRKYSNPKEMKEGVVKELSTDKKLVEGLYNLEEKGKGTVAPGIEVYSEPGDKYFMKSFGEVVEVDKSTYKDLLESGIENRREYLKDIGLLNDNTDINKLYQDMSTYLKSIEKETFDFYQGEVNPRRILKTEHLSFEERYKKSKNLRDKLKDRLKDVEEELKSVKSQDFKKNLLDLKSRLSEELQLAKDAGKYAHYIHIGTPGEKVLEPVKSWEITPNIWNNKSRAHSNVYTRGLSSMTTGGVIGTAAMSQDYRQGGIVLDLSEDEIKNTYKIKYPKIF